MSNTTRSFAYVEPTIISLLILSSFIYLLNVARSIARRLFYAGLIGEILVGIIYARPLANILKIEWQQTILDIGYLGLLLLVFEGGLETRLDILAVKSNLFLSSAIGLTGIVTPIGLSILLCTFGFKFTILESFTMGASLSVTSLGTTIVILSSQTKYQLNQSRMGMVLVGAAVLDDISGLVMASIIEKLKYLGQENLLWLIAKPIISSTVMILISILLARFVFGRLWIKLNFNNPLIKQWSDHMMLFGIILTSSATITIAAYSGASTLVGAYCCGAILRYMDDCRRELDNNLISFARVFGKYIQVVKEYIFAPFFFASIGFAVPFLDLWHGKELWQGILYSLMMIFGKFITGIWIVIWTYISCHSKAETVNMSLTTPVEVPMMERKLMLPNSSTPVSIADQSPPFSTNPVREETIETLTSLLPPSSASINKSRGVYPALIIGSSMVCRGEIGFLIANIGLSTNVLSFEAFIITIWAIILNTILGPIAVGLMVKLLGPKLSDGLWID